jgi:Domain of unknown function (DUF6398)
LNRESDVLLTPQDADLFFKLHRSLMCFVNERLQIVPDVGTPEQFSALPPETRLKVRKALLDEMDLIQVFVDANPFDLTDGELEIVCSWQHQLFGKFFLFRYLKNYTVFLSTEEPAVAYGVLALTQPFEELVGPYLPVWTETVLMPFKGKIIYDGLMSSFNISFGPGVRRNLNESFKEAKLRHGIVTSLPMSDEPMPEKAPKPKPIPEPPSREERDETLGIIIGLIDQFCQEHLNEEYAVLCRKMAEKLARKRPSPLLHGSPNAWASGIVRAVGGANFLHDKSQTPYMRSTDIDHYLGTSSSSGAAKLAAIRKMLKVHQLDPTWTLPSRLDDNPMVWMLRVNGFMMDIRHAPREAQEVAFNKGLIPYIPADRRAGE